MSVLKGVQAFHHSRPISIQFHVILTIRSHYKHYFCIEITHTLLYGDYMIFCTYDVQVKVSLRFDVPGDLSPTLYCMGPSLVLRPKNL
jgi:hypothetical protein